MQAEHFIYGVYVILFLIFVGAIMITPFIEMSGDADALYTAFSYTCHQKLSRSLCIFDDGQSFWIDNCLPQTGQYVRGGADKKITTIEVSGAVGYKIPVCARDVALYGALLLGALVYPIVREIKDAKVPPPLYLVLAVIPIALDGGLQVVSELGFVPLYESTNEIRIVTGALAGFVSSFYAIPILISLFTPRPKSR